MTPKQFIAKWRNSTLKERSASQSHFNDLCALLDVENPSDADQKGDWYCFERGASKTAGGEGWADVWKRQCFGWEYKGKKKDLTAAFAQLQQYAVALENPPLLVVSDMDRIIIHTNWTNTVSEKHEIKLDDLLNSDKREMLKWVFLDPDRLKPQKTIDALTREVADKFAGLAIRLRDRGLDPQAVAHFVNRLVFCMFAEDINLLPRHIFTQILDRSVIKPKLSEQLLSQLFASMKSGGLFGVDEIKWFNGGLFDDASAFALTREELKIIGEAATLNWSDIDPSIFGTLFERGLDPDKRSQLGAHYTDPQKIMMIVQPVVIDPLWREWEGIKTSILKPRTSDKRKRELLASFLERLRTFRVLDPACGSGNFLYLALLSLKDLEHRVNLDAEAIGLGKQLPTVGPEVVQGIELNAYAAELARVTIWIGEIQWMRKNGFGVSENPILKSLNNIECKDSIINSKLHKVKWPKTSVVIGNPPFLTARKMKPELGNNYVENLRRAYAATIPSGADLVCYWLEKANDLIEHGEIERAGLITTNSVRSGPSRQILDQIVLSNEIFDAWSDEPWTVDGAAVRVSLICITKKQKGLIPKLNSIPVHRIKADLTSDSEKKGSNVIHANRLPENRNIAFQGVVPRGSLNKKDAQKHNLPKAAFVLDGVTARSLLKLKGNPNGRPNSDVIKPFLVGDDMASGNKDRFIIDFSGMTESEASLYEKPFEYILPVKAHRKLMNQPEAFKKWWLFWNERPNMFAAVGKLSRYIITPETSKHRIFDWVSGNVVPDHKLYAIACEDDLTFGILHSRFHELWSLATCSWHGVGNDPRYTTKTCFEQFPFPDGLTPDKPKLHAKNKFSSSISTASANLVGLRRTWLFPSDMVKIVPEIVKGYPDRNLPKSSEFSQDLKKRNLTNLYNLNPTWLMKAHDELNKAVAAAYGWDNGISDAEVLERLLALNLKRTVK